MIPPKIIISLAVWNQQYVDWFLKYSWPSIQKNIPIIQGIQRNTELFIYTTRQHVDELQKYVEWKNTIYAVVAEKDIQVQMRFNDCQRDIIKRAWYERAAVVWTFPDIVMGSFECVKAKVLAGKRAIMHQGYTINETTQDFSFNVKLHSWPDLKTYTPTIIWCGDKQHLVSHGFHVNPIYVWPKQLHNTFKKSLDVDYIWGSGLDISEIDYVDARDGYHSYEITDDSNKEAVNEADCLQDTIVLSNMRWPMINREFFKRQFVLIGSEINQVAQQRADAVYKEMMT